jgi:hypothetical protein
LAVGLGAGGFLIAVEGDGLLVSAAEAFAQAVAGLVALFDKLAGGKAGRCDDSGRARGLGVDDVAAGAAAFVSACGVISFSSSASMTGGSTSCGIQRAPETKARMTRAWAATASASTARSRPLGRRHVSLAIAMAISLLRHSTEVGTRDLRCKHGRFGQEKGPAFPPGLLFN